MKKEIGEREIRYDCVENSNYIIVEFLDGKFDGIRIGSSLIGDGETIIGFNDLQRALYIAGKKI